MAGRRPESPSHPEGGGSDEVGSDPAVTAYGLCGHGAGITLGLIHEMEIIIKKLAFSICENKIK